MNYDTLTCNGVEKSFVDWGFAASSVKGNKVNQSESSFTATITGVSIATEATTPTFPFEAIVVVRANRTISAGVYSGGTIKFQGKRVGQPLKASGRGQGVTYKFENAWYDLKNTHYQQTFVGGSGATVYIGAETVLNTSTATSSGMIYCSLGDQIQAILQWLLEQYDAQGMARPFQYVGRDLNTTTIAPQHTAILASGAIDLNGTGGYSGYTYHVNSATTINADLFNIYHPSYITKPLMCSDALQKCLELFPRATIWFDHTTTPPTVHVSLPSDRTAKTLPLLDGVSHKDLSINRRDDLTARAVNILYRITNTVDGQQVVDYQPDKWGAHGSNSASDPGTGLRVVNELIELQGSASTTAKAHLDVQPVLANSLTGGTTQALKRAWWASKRGGEQTKLEDTRCRFQDKAGALTTIPEAAFIDAATGVNLTSDDMVAFGLCDSSGNLVVNRLVRGTCCPWMKRTDGQLIVSKKVRITAKMTFAIYDIFNTGSHTTNDGNIVDADDTATTGEKHTMHNSEDCHANIEITNGTSGDYSTTESVTGGENYIIGNGGIAQYLYNHMNCLQYDGDAVHVKANFADTGAADYVDLGNSLNLSNGAAEWATMNAQIQSIEEDYFHHTTTITIGVAKHLNSGQLSSLLNMWRNRRPWYNPALRSSSAAGNGGLVDLPVTAGGSANTVNGTVNNGQSANLDYTTSPSGETAGVIGGKLNHAPELITAALAAVVAGGKTPTPVSGMTDGDIKTMQPRKCLMCDEDGNQFYAMVHVSGGWTEV